MKINPILYQNQVDKFPDIYRDYQDVKSRVAPSQEDYNPVFEATPIFNRVNSFAERMSARDYTSAIGMGALAVLNGPEELDDVVSAYKQIKGKYQKPYDNKIAQHPFSFFRGTILHDYMNPNSPKCFDKVSARKWLDRDTTLMQSRLGAFISKLFNIETKEIPTSIPDITHTEKIPNFIGAKQFVTNNPFGEMTARALTRTPKLGVAALGGIEAIHTANEVSKGGDLLEEAGKSALSLTATLAATGYGGAIGAKYGGPAGSLAGMGLGAIAGYNLAHLID